MSHLDMFDRIRLQNGFLTISQLVALCEKGNVIYDPFSVLISKHAEIGTGNIFYSNIILSASSGHILKVGNNNIFYSNTVIEASAGSVCVGSENQFGEGGVTIKANRAGAMIEIGNDGRYLGGASIFGACRLESGSQVLGQITVDSCHLLAGGSWREPNPDNRGGLLKGYGTARNLMVGKGRVINGAGAFDESMLELQSTYHPTQSKER
ncbi:hypothetical protein [Dickeya zeae]|uniref:hypothetical protein n=1 Tax=Dickeya zeae TaxID=204042 RepID=UPI000C9A0EB1|nr:hypothetical protein [Dickeya zeae]AUQ23952.1 hypothetical protein C1O30_02130 [Dickeya zeae]PXW46622.1 hypothetical protein DFO54_10412 [Erwinia sp. AG740]UJR57076.1 hypothetical protein HJ580_02110 [Dickeya zeae]